MSGNVRLTSSSLIHAESSFSSESIDVASTNNSISAPFSVPPSVNREVFSNNVAIAVELLVPVPGVFSCAGWSDSSSEALDGPPHGKRHVPKLFSNSIVSTRPSSISSSPSITIITSPSNFRAICLSSCDRSFVLHGLVEIPRGSC
jgi:hypothetical protein